MSSDAGWACLCFFMAAIPWLIAVMFGKLRRVTLLQIGLMVLLLAIGLGGPRLGLHRSFLALGMFAYSAIVVTLGPDE